MYWLGVVGVITLAPFDFYLPSTIQLTNFGPPFAVVASAFLFVPLGFLYPLTRRGREQSPTLVAALGLMLGGAIALAQVCQTDRTAAIAGIVASGIGAGAGALLLQTANQRIRSRTRLAGRLSLELPLVALIYLLVPLVVAASLSVVDDRLQAISLVPLALLGARLISAVQEHHFARASVFRRHEVALIGAGWTLLGVFPVFAHNPVIGAGLVLLVGLATAHESVVPAVYGGDPERRFEAAVLRSAVPYIAVYFATAIFLPLALGLADWRMAIGLTGSNNDAARQFLRSLEPVTALTLLGYVLAEARGRRELRFRQVATRIGAECACVALAFEGSRGFQRGAGASLSELSLMIGASLVGAALYHSQRERIRRILIHRDGGARVAGTSILPRESDSTSLVRWSR